MLRWVVCTLSVASVALVSTPAVSVTQWEADADAWTVGCPDFCTSFSPMDLEVVTGSLILNVPLQGAAGDASSPDFDTSLFVQVHVFDEANLVSPIAISAGR